MTDFFPHLSPQPEFLHTTPPHPIRGWWCGNGIPHPSTPFHTSTFQVWKLGMNPEPLSNAQGWKPSGSGTRACARGAGQGQIVSSPRQFERGHCTRSGNRSARYVRRTLSHSGIPQRYIAVRRYSCLTRVDFTIMRRYEGRV